MPNNYLSVLYKLIIKVENENAGLKVGSTNISLPPNQKSGGVHAPMTHSLSPPPRFLHQCIGVENKITT